MSRVNIILDLDETLLIREFSKTDFVKIYQKYFPKNYFEIYNSKSNTKFFLLLLPGTVELVTWLLQHKDATLHFYSSATLQMNTLSIAQILKVANFDIKEIIDLMMRDNFLYSRHNCKNLKKDLSLIRDPLDDKIILIDNSPRAPLKKQLDHTFIHAFYTRDQLEPHADKISYHNVSLRQVFYITGILQTLLDKGTDDFVNRLHQLLSDKEMLSEKEYDQFCEKGLTVLRTVNPMLELPEPVPYEMRAFLPNEEDKYESDESLDSEDSQDNLFSFYARTL